jgi:hypothetical protein
VNLDWHRLKAVVLESDDWGLCAWVPDEKAFRVLADTPAFRAPAGRRYAGTTLESADDVKRLAATLQDFRGGDGFPPVWQANTVMAAPDYQRLRAPAFEATELPLVDFPHTPTRWERPGLWEEIAGAQQAGLWWPELHGLHHLPESAWLAALRRGIADARRAHEQQSPICEAVQASGEYDRSEPAEDRRRRLTLAVEKFRALFGRTPGSFCPPDYRWDESTEADAERLGVTTWQGRSERAGRPLPRLTHFLGRYRWPEQEGARFYLPPRIAFEPAAEGRDARQQMIERTHRLVRAAWSRGQPAIVSTHRANYAHLDPDRSDAGRSALRDLIALVVRDEGSFVTDAEVRGLHDRGWSSRPIGARGSLVRYHGVPREPVRLPAPAGTWGVALREGGRDATVKFSRDHAELRADVGEYLLEWESA